MDLFKKEKELNAKNLKKILWETLQKLQKNEIDSADASAMAMQSREIVRIINSQRSIIQESGKAMSKELVDYATKD